MTAPAVAVPGPGADGAVAADWSGRWVADRLAATVHTTAAPLGVSVPDLVGLALRRNPRRAHLLVSRVLGKHVPADPRLVYGAGLLLGQVVRAALTGADLPTRLGGQLRVALTPGHPGQAPAAATLTAAVRAHQAARPHPATSVPPTVVLGYAETATALGHAVADALDAATYLHSTRRAVPGREPVGGFPEEHSHATGHLLVPAEPGALLNDLPLVLVDDELSTGTTALNTIVMLHRLHPRRRYVVAALVDCRSAADRSRMAQTAAALGATIEVVALASGRINLATDAVQRGQRLVAALDRRTGGGTRRGSISRAVVGWPTGLPETGRHGFSGGDRERLGATVDAMADRLAAAVPPAAGDHRLLVLGVEELMYVPLRLATALADRLDGTGTQVRFSTTTRSPVLAVDDAGYAIRHRLTFPVHDDPARDHADDGLRYAYNVPAPSGRSTVLLVLDTAADTEAAARPGGLLDALASVSDQVLVTAVGRPA